MTNQLLPSRPNVPATGSPGEPGPPGEAISTAALEAPAGLKRVIVARTAIGSVRGSEGFYHYRQFDAVELARHASLEAVWFLLHGEGDPRLPAADEEEGLSRRIGAARRLPADRLSTIRQLAEEISSPHLLLQAAFPLLVPGARPTMDLSHDARAADVLRVMAAVPTILGVGLAATAGRSVLNAEPARSHAADWYRMATGRVPTDLEERAVETYLIATIDHGFNASTFASRVVASTGADVVSALSAGVGALSGPLHGGAPARALAMIDEIGDPSRAATWWPIGWPAVIVTNVEYYAGVVLHLAGLPAEAFTPSFMVSRVIGWGAHVMEQAADNKIFRPSSRYVGPEPIRGGRR